MTADVTQIALSEEWEATGDLVLDMREEVKLWVRRSQLLSRSHSLV